MQTRSFHKIIFSVSLAALGVVAVSCGGTTAGGGRIGERDGGTGGTTGSGGATGTGGSSGAGGSGPACVNKSECAVPAICKICADGGPTVCATADCVNGHCVTYFPDCGGQLTWWQTCGYPVCPAGSDASLANPCSAAAGQTVGAPCTTPGAECDYDTCGSKLLCATSDPKPSVGCPISRAKYKQDIRYLSSEERATLADELQSIPLVRYRYKGAPERDHLGFIIEDIEPSPSVDSARDSVDLYGYTSMAVAALQEQHTEIVALKKQVQELEARLSQAAKSVPAHAARR